LHKNGDSRYDDTFEIIYDTTVTEYFANKLPQNKNRRNRATSLSQVGENAKVEIKNIEFQNKVKTADMLNYMESTVTLHFQNTSKREQEVVMHFSLPSKYSVISDLKLGLNGELIGQIAPRGAANKVYTQSLIRNIDPALLEKV
jgi:DNA relaxase NicK